MCAFNFFSDANYRSFERNIKKHNSLSLCFFIPSGSTPSPLVQNHSLRLSAELMHPSALQSINKQPQQGRNCDLMPTSTEWKKTGLITKMMIVEREPSLKCAQIATLG